jgi:Raf kinase inhibitor-like YbhB/YbcL family protein
MIPLKIASPAFDNGGVIPDKYTCNGQNINPEIIIKDIPTDAKSLAVIMYDPDAPMGTWVHWVVWNLEPNEKIPENSSLGEAGLNSWNKKSYGGPCPPSGTHRYFFKIYALDTELSLKNSEKKEVESAIKGHILAQGELIGTYTKK